MPTLPTARDLHVDSLLTDFAIAHGQDLAKDYAADSAATLVRTQHQSDKFIVWDIGDIFRSQMQPRADGEVTRQGGIRIDTSNTFFSEVFGLHTLLTDRQKANADSPIMAEQQKVRWLMMQAKLNREKLYQRDIFATGKWTANTEQTGVAAAPGANQFLQWNDSSSDPILDITTEMLTIQTATGRMPNIGVCNPTVARRLIDHPDFVDRVKNSGEIPALVTIDRVAAVLGLDRIIVGNAVENTAAEGQTEVMANVFDKDFLLVHITPEMTDEEPTAVGAFIWNAFEGVTKEGAAIGSWFDRDRKATKFEIEDAYVAKITSQQLGVFFKSAVA